MTARHSSGSGASRRGWGLLRAAATWAALVLCAFAMWPAAFGGYMSYVFVSGESMTPGFSPGDLLVARKGEPMVGDVIVYTPQGYGDAQIVHRVIGGDADNGWQVQGDANDFIDPFTPTGDQIRGVVVAHASHDATAMQLLLSPFVWVGLLAIATAVLVWPTRDTDDDLLSVPTEMQEMGAR